MTVSTTLQQFQTTSGVREDLYGVITNIAPTDTPMLSSFKAARATNTYTEWLTDSLATATANSQVEGSSATNATLSARTRVGNYLQIFRKVFEVSDTTRAINNVGMSDEYTYQAEKAMKELARDIEWTLVNGTSASGDSATARSLAGVSAFVTTNVMTSGSARILTETIYNTNLQTIWGQGGNPDVTYCAGWGKRKISAFTATSTRFIDTDSKLMIAGIDIYDSDFGRQKIKLDRYVPVSCIMQLEEGKFDIARLRPIKHVPLAKVGSSTRGMIEAELTMRCLTELASGIIWDISTTA